MCRKEMRHRAMTPFTYIAPDDPDASQEDWSGVTLESFARSAAEVREWHAILDRKHAPKTQPKGKAK